MRVGVEELKAYLTSSGINAEILELKDEVKTVNQAAKVLGVSKEQIIKTIMFIDALGEPVLAIVRGDQKVDNKKLANVVGTIGVRMASAKEVKKHSGYAIGGLPPIGHKQKIKTVIDEKVLEKEFVYGGGGTEKHLLKISPKDIQKLTDAIVANIGT